MYVERKHEHTTFGCTYSPSLDLALTRDRERKKRQRERERERERDRERDRERERERVQTVSVSFLQVYCLDLVSGEREREIKRERYVLRQRDEGRERERETRGEIHVAGKNTVYSQLASKLPSVLQLLQMRRQQWPPFRRNA